MSVPPPEDRFRPDRPEQIEVSRRALASALAHAAAGYRVVPVLRGAKRPPRKDMREGAADVGHIMAWWNKYPTCDVGIVLDGTGLVVLDVDSAQGERSLTTLAGTEGQKSLPGTYEVLTSRGRHLWYRIPLQGSRELASQIGGQHGRPGLDVKMTWLLVVPGTTSASGHLYRANWDHLPAAEELPFLPDHAWAQIEARARSKHVSAGRRQTVKRPPRHEEPVELQGGSPVALTGSTGLRLAALLADDSHGRDVRIFSVVRMLVQRGVEDRDIWCTLRGSALGKSKFSEQGDPVGYFFHKVDSAVDYLDAEQPQWNPATWLDTVLRSGLGDSEVRVLAYLFDQANGAGIVSRGTGRIAVGAALSTSQAGTVIKRLIEGGWLRVLREYDKKTMTPRTYSLDVPEGTQIPGTVSREDGPHPTLSLTIPIRNLIGLCGHDAFRTCAKGKVAALGRHFRVLCLLADRSRSKVDLRTTLRCSPQTVDRLIRALAGCGLVVGDDTGYMLTTEPLSPLLGQVARAAGTDGIGAAQWEAYLAECARHAEYRRRMAIVGTEEWRLVHVKDCEALFDAPEPPGSPEGSSRTVIPNNGPDLRLILKWWEEVGVQRREVAEMMVDTLEGTYRQAELAFKDFDWSSVGQGAA